MRPHLALTVAVTAVALLASALSGVHRRAALMGSTVASATAFASLVAMGRVIRSGKRPLNGPLAVVVAMFLLRLALLGLATVLVVRARESVIGLVVAFLVPYFAFAAIEGAFVHSLARSQGPSA